jgi:hypothetical protein
MARDPAYKGPLPRRKGYLEMPGHELYYEVRATDDRASREKIIMVRGSYEVFGPLRSPRNLLATPGKRLLALR